MKTKGEEEEAEREAAPKLSFDVDTSVDNGAAGKGESISISTTADSDFVGGPKVVPMEARAAMSTLLSLGEEQSLEASMSGPAGEDPVRQQEVDDELTRALGSRVELKSGGHLVIEQTEAMTTVDVNTGAYLGKHSLEETVFRTNLEAAQVLPRQLRLRNLGGIIVVDFIDMEDEEHRRQVLRALEKACEGDPARIRIEGFSSLGLVQMSRKRTRESLIQQLGEPCSHCEGAGVVKTAQSTCIEIFRSIMQDEEGRCGAAAEGDYVIRAADNVVDRLLDEDADQLAAMASRVGRRVRIELEPSYGAGEFDIVLVNDTQ